MRRKTRITIEQVEAWRLCDDYSLSRIGQLFGRRKYFTLDQLKMIDIPASDKLWCLLHEEVIPAPQLHLLACEYAEHALLREREAGREPDPRSWAAIDTKRRWVRKEATDSELLAARAAARAAGAAAWEAARAAEIAWQLDRAFEAANAAEKWGVMTLEALNKAMLRSADFIAAVEQYRVRLAENDYAHFGCKESAAVRRASMDLTRALAELRRS